MDDKKIRSFITLAGGKLPASFDPGDPARRELGAHLLLSEVLEYVVYGLGVQPIIDGVAINDPKQVSYRVTAPASDQREMLDGLADVAYTMYWNSCSFGLPLEEAFERVCDNNLEKFVHLPQWQQGAGPLPREAWDCGWGVTWPDNVVTVEVLQVSGEWYAVGKDNRGKVRKPSTYAPVDLSSLMS